MVSRVFNDSPFHALNAAYPNQFRKWELLNTPVNFWNEAMGIRAARWLIAEKLKLTDNEIKKSLLMQTVYDQGFCAMIKKSFNYVDCNSIKR